MGHRAVFGYTDEQGHSTVTTVQWSTGVDQTIKFAIPHMIDSGMTFREAARDIFQEIRKHDHISMLNIEDDNYREKFASYGINENSIILFVMEDEDGKNLYLTVDRPQNNDAPVNNVTGNIDKIVKSHNHADDGISMWYDEKNDPDTIHFWIEDDYDYILNGRELTNFTA